jgi:ABC-2 type transport system ATP-binding protein
VQSYGRVPALAGVDLTVAPGVVSGLVGPNGSGKTTALHVAAGLITPRAGTAIVCGFPAGSQDARRRVALVPDEPAGFDELTPEEYLGLVRSLWGCRGIGESRRAATLIESFGLARHLPKRLAELSRGLRRRVAIVGALQLALPMTLIDEAAAALDPEAVVALRAAVAALAERGGSVLLATQDLWFAQRACLTVTLLDSGRAVAAGPPADLCRDHGGETLEDVLLDVLGERNLGEAVRDALVAP